MWNYFKVIIVVFSVFILTLHNIYYTLHTTHYTSHTTHYTLHTTYHKLHTTHYTLHTTYHRLHTIKYIKYIKYDYITSITNLRLRLNWMTSANFIDYKLITIVKKIQTYDQPHNLRQVLNMKTNSSKLRYYHLKQMEPSSQKTNIPHYHH